ncbi:hypothetical protein GOZ90_16130 [Agrobacterium vitis]|uniref:Uncharacterized protein n=1 Tax=Agrobacterium vitis TaxID=373 RepID=A0A6L6VIV0_AGRVI|nr:hypothetical protein [Agrobacterium vitis]MUZ74217.1 hypothetical protein [Agrobacterium vitis]
MNRIIAEHLNVAKLLAEREGEIFLTYLISMAQMENDPGERLRETKIYEAPKTLNLSLPS